MGNLLSADYVILCVSAGTAVVGLFIGFSGALAFLVASVAAALSGKASWILSVNWVSEPWVRGLATLVLTLLAFGLVRWGVKKIVNGLLRQPADAIFGFIVAGLTGFLLSVVALCALESLGFMEFPSALVSCVRAFIAS